MTQWKLVPVEPTREMIEAAFGAINYTMPEPSEDAGRVYSAMLSAAPSPDGDEVERAAEQPAWGVWVDYNRAPPGSYACLVSTLVNGEWGEPEAKWMPAQGRPPLPGKIRIMPHLMPGDPLALSALPRRETEGPDYKAMFEAVEKRLQECEKHLREWRLIALNDAVRNRRVGKWLSAALEDPSTCDEMKADIRAWFDAGKPVTVPTLTEEDSEAFLLVLCDVVWRDATEGACGWPSTDHRREMISEAREKFEAAKLANQEPTP